MCGFFGNIFSESHTNNKKRFFESSKLLAHRGPDDESSFFNKYINITFYRLSIRDLSKNGRQPMLSKSKSFLLCFNGEIYNSEYIRKKYIGNLDLKGNSDTEILLECFAKKGIEILENVEGMFSFFIHDFNSTIKNNDQFIG